MRMINLKEIGMTTKLLIFIISMLITGSVISATQTDANLDDEFNEFKVCSWPEGQYSV